MSPRTRPSTASDTANGRVGLIHAQGPVPRRSVLQILDDQPLAPETAPLDWDTLCEALAQTDGITRTEWRPASSGGAGALTLSERANDVTEPDNAPFPAIREGGAESEAEVAAAWFR